MIRIDRRTATAWALFITLAAAGCAGSPSTGDRAAEPSGTVPVATTPAPTLEQAREAGADARAIEAEPSRTPEILTEHNMTAESLENLILEISKDPALSEAYEAARKGSSG